MKKVGLGFVQVFWGNGKGKTTSAFGTALRACGNGYKVHLVQFMKNGVGDSDAVATESGKPRTSPSSESLQELEDINMPGEIKALERFDNFSFKRFGTDGWVIKKPTEGQIAAVRSAVDYVRSCFEKEHDIIIADEILYAIQLGLLTEDEVIDLIDSKPEGKELILTGSHKAYPRIFEKANLVTEIRKIKHPFDDGFIARKGLEY